MIEYHEPIWGDNGAITGDILVCITEAQAIEQQRAAALQRNVSYLYDVDALNDFIAINWARQVP